MQYLLFSAKAMHNLDVFFDMMQLVELTLFVTDSDKRFYDSVCPFMAACPSDVLSSMAEMSDGRFFYIRLLACWQGFLD